METPFELLSCTWPRPLAEREGRWAAEPEWDAPLMPSRPEARWRSFGDRLWWAIDWREWFKRGLGLDGSSLGGQMRGFHVVFRLKVNAAGRLFIFDEDGSIVRREGRELYRAAARAGGAPREIEVAAGDVLEVAQGQRGGPWMWGARLAGGPADDADKSAAEVLMPYREAALRRLEQPEGPPLKLYTSGAHPVRAIACLYSLVLNGYAPSKVLLYGDYQWTAQARALFAELLPFAEVVPTGEVLARLREAGGPALAQTALKHWFVMKTFVALLCPPAEFCLMDDDVFVLGRMDDALEAFRAHELVYTPDFDHSDEYLQRWGWLHGRRGEHLTTADFNAGLYFMRHAFDPRHVARQTSRVRPQYCHPYVWEQGYIANLFARARTHSLPTQRYFFPLSDGLPGGPLGYDYAQNPCGFTTVHFAGLSEKPTDAATLLLLPHLLGRALRRATRAPAVGAEPPADEAQPAPAAAAEPASVVGASAPDAPASVEERAPLVSCVMPTADRRAYVEQAVRLFLRQDYAHLELVVIDDGADPVADCLPTGDPRFRYFRLDRRLNIGAKRNFACEQSRGRIIVHWDDDDWYPAWRVGAQVRALEDGGFDLCGTSRLFYFEAASGRAWLYSYSQGGRPWVAGNTLAYRKSLWERRRFPNVRAGEDTRFVMGAPGARVQDLRDPRLCVGTIHPSNTSRKATSGDGWSPEPAASIRELLGEDLDFYSAPAREARADAGRPLVSCVMPTRDRRPFVALALSNFARQDYPHKELVVIDDGSDAVGDLCEGVEGVRYVRLPARTSIGGKRNLALREARGEVIAHWDDDDWYAPERLSYQVAPLLSGEADLTGLVNSFVLELPGGNFWTVLPHLHRRLFVGDVHGGTLVFRRSLLDLGVRYPETNLAEDAALILQARRRGQRLLRLDNRGVFVYVRHGSNAWREYAPGTFLDPRGWQTIDSPATFTASQLSLYIAAAQAHAAVGL